MITVKDYAAKKGVTERAVYKQLKSKRNAERLEGHIQIIEGKQWLDDTAVEILDESRSSSPVIFVQENKDQKIEELENTIKQMLVRENELQREISNMNKELAEAYKWKAENAVALAEANKNQLLLEEKNVQLQQKQKEVKTLEGFLRDANSNIEHLQEEKRAALKATEDKLHLAEQRADQLQQQLDVEKNKTFFQRLFGKR